MNFGRKSKLFHQRKNAKVRGQRFLKSNSHCRNHSCSITLGFSHLKCLKYLWQS